MSGSGGWWDRERSNRLSGSKNSKVQQISEYRKCVANSFGVRVDCRPTVSLQSNKFQHAYNIITCIMLLNSLHPNS